jgi:hypothetical protein
MEKNPALQEKFLGPSPVLEKPHLVVLEVYWMLRRGTPSDRGIPITLRDLQEYDSLLIRLLSVGDAAFLEEAAKGRDESMRTPKKPSRSR